MLCMLKPDYGELHSMYERHLKTSLEKTSNNSNTVNCANL